MSWRLDGLEITSVDIIFHLILLAVIAIGFLLNHFKQQMWTKPKDIEWKKFEVLGFEHQTTEIRIRTLDVLKAQYVVIIVPTIKHITDAYALATYILIDMGANVVTTIELNQLSDWTKTVTGESGYVILSHSLTISEKKYILEQLEKNDISYYSEVDKCVAIMRN